MIDILIDLVQGFEAIVSPPLTCWRMGPIGKKFVSSISDPRAPLFWAGT